ncbi:MAG: DinB family protein [Desulfuromonadales bacterium]|nr:DinB family protein [Desulfuromonadales bacterium]
MQIGRPSTIATIAGAINDTFSRLEDLCAQPADYLHHRPAYADAWTVAEHLEHISLVNHFLLLTIAKGVATALRRARTRPVPPGESDLLRLGPIADPAAFPWEPPGHMIPTGVKPVAEVRALLTAQHGECLGLLERMGASEGRLCSFRMSVDNLGMLDMYQWLYFLTRHGCWHLEFLARRDVSD